MSDLESKKISIEQRLKDLDRLIEEAADLRVIAKENLHYVLPRRETVDDNTENIKPVSTIPLIDELDGRIRRLQEHLEAIKTTLNQVVLPRNSLRLPSQEHMFYGTSAALNPCNLGATEGNFTESNRGIRKN